MSYSFSMHMKTRTRKHNYQRRSAHAWGANRINMGPWSTVSGNATTRQVREQETVSLEFVYIQAHWNPNYPFLVIKAVSRLNTWRTLLPEEFPWLAIGRGENVCVVRGKWPFLEFYFFMWAQLEIFLPNFYTWNSIPRWPPSNVPNSSYLGSGT